MFLLSLHPYHCYLICTLYGVIQSGDIVLVHHMCRLFLSSNLHPLCCYLICTHLVVTQSKPSGIVTQPAPPVLLPDMDLLVVT